MKLQLEILQVTFKSRFTQTSSRYYVTKDEFLTGHSIQNLTLSELKKEIFRTLEFLDEESARLQTEVYHKNIKSKRKEVHIEFYYKLCDVLDDFSKASEEELPGPSNDESLPEH